MCDVWLGRVGRWEPGRDKESDSKQMDVAKDLEKEIKREGDEAATTIEPEASSGGREAETNAVDNINHQEGMLDSPLFGGCC